MKKSAASECKTLSDGPSESHVEPDNLRLRSELVKLIAKHIEASGWTQLEAAVRAGTTQPRMNDLVRGRIARFSLDGLVNIAAALGQRVQIKLRAVY